MFYGNLAQLDRKVKFGNQVQISNGQNLCNVRSMEGVTVYGHPQECRVAFGRGGPHIVS